MSFKLGFERVHWVSQMDNRRKTAPASRTSSQESMIALILRTWRSVLSSDHNHSLNAVEWVPVQQSLKHRAKIMHHNVLSYVKLTRCMNLVKFFLFRILCGLSQFTKKGHIARACLEAVCFQTREVILLLFIHVLTTQQTAVTCTEFWIIFLQDFRFRFFFMYLFLEVTLLLQLS